jgi:hypothetical protein
MPLFSDIQVEVDGGGRWRKAPSQGQAFDDYNRRQVELQKLADVAQAARCCPPSLARHQQMEHTSPCLFMWPEGEEAWGCCAGLLSGADRIVGLGILDRRFCAI